MTDPNPPTTWVLPEPGEEVATEPEPGGGRYRRVARIAAGGTADIYEAEDTVLRRRVVLKVRRPGAFGDTSQLGQAQLMASGELDGLTLAPRDFIAAEGITVYDRLDDTWATWFQRDASSAGGNLTVPRLRELADVLRRVHAAGHWHGDFKPDNVGIVRGRIVLIDMTPEGQRLYTPGWAPHPPHPGHGMGPPRDVWALGRIIREAGPMAPADAAVLQTIATRAQEPGATAFQVVQDLDALIRGDLVPGHRYRAAERAILLGRAHVGTLLVIVGVMVVGVVTTGVGVGVVRFQVLERQRAAREIEDAWGRWSKRDDVTTLAADALAHLAEADDADWRGLFIAARSVASGRLSRIGDDAGRMCWAGEVHPRTGAVACVDTREGTIWLRDSRGIHVARGLYASIGFVGDELLVANREGAWIGPEPGSLRPLPCTGSSPGQPITVARAAGTDVLVAYRNGDLSRCAPNDATPRWRVATATASMDDTPMDVFVAPGRAIVADGGSCLRPVDLETGELLPTVCEPGWTVAANPATGDLLATGRGGSASGERVQILDPEGIERGRFVPDVGPVQAEVVLPGPPARALIVGRNAAEAWDLTTRRAIGRFALGATTPEFSGGAPRSAWACGPDAACFLSRAGGMWRWDPPTTRDVWTSEFPVPVIALAVSPTGFVAADGGRDLRIWDPSGAEVGRWVLPQFSAGLGWVSPDELYVGGSNGHLHSVSLRDPTLRDRGRIEALGSTHGLEANGDTVAIGGEGHTLVVRSATGDRIVGSYVGSVANIVTAGGIHHVSVMDGMIHRYDADWNELDPIAVGRPDVAGHPQQDTLGEVSVAPDGSELSVGRREDPVVLRFHLPDLRPLPPVAGDARWTLKAAYSPTRRVLATGGLEGLIQLWEVPSGSLLATIRAHDGIVWGVGFSPDGSLLHSVGSDGHVAAWNVDGIGPGR